MDQIAIGRFIAKKRKEKNYTQEILANKLGVSFKTVSKWECGKCMPDYSIIELLCHELSITMAELMDGEESEKSIRCITNEEILELFNKKEKQCIKKKFWIGIMFILIGMTNLITYLIIGKELSDFIIGFMVSFGSGLIIVGIIFIVYSICKMKIKQ